MSSHHFVHTFIISINIATVTETQCPAQLVGVIQFCEVNTQTAAEPGKQQKPGINLRQGSRTESYVDVYYSMKVT